jgi:hypothetical protein
MASVEKRPFYLWPPLKVKEANQAIQNRAQKTEWESIINSIRESLPENAGDDDYKELEEMAKQVHESEAERREELENKASAFLYGSGIAASIISIALKLGFDTHVPTIPMVFSVVLFLVAILHMLFAAYYAVMTRRPTPLAHLSADVFINSLTGDGWKTKERITHTIGRVKWNEYRILLKSNYLYAAEELFLRGLILFGCGAITGFIGITMAHFDC